MINIKQETRFRSRNLNHGTDLRALVHREVVLHQDVARLELGAEGLADVGEEDRRVGRSRQPHAGGASVQSDGGDHRGAPTGGGWLAAYGPVDALTVFSWTEKDLPLTACATAGMILSSGKENHQTSA